MKRTRAVVKTCIDFSIDFSLKIDQKTTRKTRKAIFATKIDKKAFLGAPFLAKSSFFVIFGVPRGTQKLSKIYESVVTKWSWKPSGGHFGRFTAFYSISNLFWVHSQPLRAHFLANLCVFQLFWLFSGLLCFHVFSLFLLAVFLVGWVNWCCWSFGWLLTSMG